MVALVVFRKADKVADELTALITLGFELSLKGVSAEFSCLVFEAQFGVGLCEVEVGKGVAVL